MWFVSFQSSQVGQYEVIKLNNLVCTVDPPCLMYCSACRLVQYGTFLHVLGKHCRWKYLREGAIG